MTGNVRLSNFQAALLEELGRLTVEDITAQTDIARCAVNILTIEQKITALQQPVTITGVPKDAADQLQVRIDSIHASEVTIETLLSSIIWQGAEIFAKAVVEQLKSGKGGE